MNFGRNSSQELSALPVRIRRRAGILGGIPTSAVGKRITAARLSKFLAGRSRSDARQVNADGRIAKASVLVESKWTKVSVNCVRAIEAAED